MQLYHQVNTELIIKWIIQFLNLQPIRLICFIISFTHLPGLSSGAEESRASSTFTRQTSRLNTARHDRDTHSRRTLAHYKLTHRTATMRSKVQWNTTAFVYYWPESMFCEWMNDVVACVDKVLFSGVKELNERFRLERLFI